MGLLYSYAVVGAFPAIFIGPEKGEDGLTSDWQCGRRQVEHVDAEPGVARLRILITLPPVDTPMHNSWLEQHDAEGLVSWNRAALVVKPPPKDLPRRFLS